jgi:hypothetical protein
MKNWKTTIAGLTAGGSIAADALCKAYISGTFTGQTGIQLVLSISIIIFGAVSKDHNVTGGSIEQ